MTIGIYAIRNKLNGKVYVGKSVNIEARWYCHKWSLKTAVRPKDCNRHLWLSVKKHGLSAFSFEVIESFDVVDERAIAERELYWIDKLNSCDRQFGYNLRRDSSSRMLVHEETRARISHVTKGDKNGNFGNKWTQDMKSSMSVDALRRHSEGRYGEEWRTKISKASSRIWVDAEKKAAMAAKVAEAKLKYYFVQYTKSGEIVRVWSSVKEIVEVNPEYKWQNIYSVCNGYKGSYRGFVWRSYERTDSLIA